MTTKLIAAFIIVVVLYGGWHLFLYWDKVKSEKESVRKEAAAAVVTGESLPGLPSGEVGPVLRKWKSPGALGAGVQSISAAKAFPAHVVAEPVDAARLCENH